MSYATVGLTDIPTRLPSQLPYQAPTRIVLSSGPRLFALLIGINTYANVNSLRGAVADVRAFKRYLGTCLGVPNDHIQLLLNKSASRSSILAALVRLRDNPEIEKGDAILIFYAGHGSEVALDSGDDKVQVIISQDYFNDREKPVPPIPCRDIDKALHQVASIKGNNIIVIYDCSFSGSVNQSKTSLSFVRSVDLAPWTGSSLRRLTDELDGESTPNIVLNACSPSEKARECRGRGLFSTALLRLLHSVSPDQLEWSEILSHMDQIPNQNPQCKGSIQIRYLFDGKVVAKERPRFHLNVADNQFILNAGTTGGIVKGAELSVYAETDISLLSPYGRLTVEVSRPFSAIMSPSPIDVPPEVSSLIAVQTKRGKREDVRFYCPNDEAHSVFYEAFVATMGTADEDWNIVIVESAEDAHLEVTIEAGRIIFFAVKDRTISQYGVKRLFYGVGLVVEEIVPVIKAAARYFWALHLTESNAVVNSNVQVEVLQLQPVVGDTVTPFGHTMFAPVGPNLYHGDIIDLVLKEEDVPYGMKLTNNSAVDLYPNVFYFDGTDLSVVPYYQCKTEEPLKANGGSVTIGYGPSSEAPFRYFLRDTQNHDIGFIKVFFSTRRADLSSLIQQSPTTTPSNATKPRVDQLWGTILLPAIQRRVHTSPTGEWACTQCGFVVAPNLEEEYMQTENEDLKFELESYRESISRQKQVLKAEYQSTLAKVDRKRTKSGRISTSSYSGRYLSRGTDIANIRAPPVNDPDLMQPRGALAPPARLPSLWASILQYGKRILRLWA